MAAYVYGNVVRKETMVPEHIGQQRANQRARRKQKTPIQMNRGYVIFLAAAAVVALFACVKYLQLQSEVTNRSKYISSLQQEVAEMKEENTTKYNAIMNTMNLEEIRDIAMNQFGMVYAEADQIIKYKSPDGSSITQHANIPESGIVVTSETVE